MSAQLAKLGMLFILMGTPDGLDSQPARDIYCPGEGTATTLGSLKKEDGEKFVNVLLLILVEQHRRQTGDLTPREAEKEYGHAPDKQ